MPHASPIRDKGKAALWFVATPPIAARFKVLTLIVLRWRHDALVSLRPGRNMRGDSSLSAARGPVKGLSPSPSLVGLKTRQNIEENEGKGGNNNGKH